MLVASKQQTWNDALTLREGLLAAGGLGEKLLALGDGLAAEADALLGVEDGALPDEGLDATGTAIDLVEGDLVDDLGAVLTAGVLVLGRGRVCRGNRIAIARANGGRGLLTREET